MTVSAPKLFAGLSPPTPETFVAQLRGRYRFRLRIAIGHIREALEVTEPERKLWNLCQAAYYVGVADGMVYALYDANTADAHSALKRVERVGFILGTVRDCITRQELT